MNAQLHPPARRLRFICGLLGVLHGTVHMANELRLAATSTGSVIAVQAMLPDDMAAVEVVWRQVPGAHPVVEVRQGDAPHEGRWLMLDQVLEAGVGAYLDARLRYTRTGVTSELPAMAMAGEMNAMIQAAARTFGVEGASLSSATMAQLVRFTALDWSATAELPSVRSGAQDKYLVIYRVLEAHRGELNRQLHTDLIPMADVAVWGDPPKADPRTSYPIASTCGTVFDTDNFMCALELTMDESALPVVEPMLRIPAGALSAKGANGKSSTEGGRPGRKRDAWLQAELRAIHARLDALDDTRRDAALDERVRDLEDALAGLRVELNERTAPSEPWELPGSVDGAVMVRFDGEDRLPADQRGRLDLLAMQLAAMPSLRVVVYGITTDDGRGVRTAEQRAATVRGYLIQKGAGAAQVLSGMKHGAPRLVLVEAMP